MNTFARICERILVWLGGGVFVLALAVTAAMYALRFGQPRPWAGWIAVAYDVALFSLFAFHHSFFARERVKAALTRVISERLLRSTYVWIASVLLLAVCWLWTPIGGELYQGHTWLAALSAVVQLTGVLLIGRSVSAIDALELAGIRPSSLTRRDEELQVSGPYRLVRHPLYLGWVLIVFGTSFMTGDRLAFASITLFYLIIAMPWEERSLERTFGQSYARYKRTVRWRILPFLY